MTDIKDLVFYRTKSGEIAVFNPKDKSVKDRKKTSKVIRTWNRKQIKLDGDSKGVLIKEFKQIWNRSEDVRKSKKILPPKNDRLKLKRFCGAIVHYDPYMETTSIKSEYDKKLPPGKIDINGKKRRDDEMRTARFLAEKLGGDVVFDIEDNGDGYAHPDNTWRDKVWEIKTPSNPGRFKDRLKDGIEKAYRIKGHKLDGIIMNVENTDKISEDEAKRIAFEIMNRMCVRQTDVMIKYGDELLEIYRIKHK